MTHPHEYTFLTRFGLLKATDETFHKFLNVTVAPEVKGSEMVSIEDETWWYKCFIAGSYHIGTMYYSN